MVTTRSGGVVRVAKQPKATKSQTKERKRVLDSSIRLSADNTHHVCGFCLVKLVYVEYTCNLSQCPYCRDVCHTKCLDKWLNDGNTTCINCRHEISEDDDMFFEFDEDSESDE